ESSPIYGPRPLPSRRQARSRVRNAVDPRRSLMESVVTGSDQDRIEIRHGPYHHGAAGALDWAAPAISHAAVAADKSLTDARVWELGAVTPASTLAPQAARSGAGKAGIGKRIAPYSPFTAPSAAAVGGMRQWMVMHFISASVP